MKQHSFFKPIPALVIGILGALALAPFAAVNAQTSRDRDMNQQTSPAERLDTSPPSTPSEESTTTPSDSRGAQGPLRSDTTTAPSTEDEREQRLRQEREDQQKLEQGRSTTTPTPTRPMGGSGNNY